MFALALGHSCPPLAPRHHISTGLKKRTMRGFKDVLIYVHLESASTGSMCALACLDSRGNKQFCGLFCQLIRINENIGVSLVLQYNIVIYVAFGVFQCF